MDLIPPVLGSDNESGSDALILDTDYDFSVVDDLSPPTSSVNHTNIGSVWSDIVVEDQMEGCLNRLEVTTKKGYADIDDPNHGFRNPYYSQMNCMNRGQKRKRDVSLSKINQKTENIIDTKYNFEFHPVMKNLCVNSNTKKSRTKKKKKKKNGEKKKKNVGKKKNAEKKKSVEKKKVEKKNNADNQSLGHLSNIINSEKKTLDELANDLCTNLCEYNKILMLSLISKIDRKIIIDKYNKTCLIEANGGQMTKIGDRKRTPGGIFFNLIKEDKSISNNAKKELFGVTQSKTLRNKMKTERRNRKKVELKKMIAQGKIEAEKLKKLNNELEIQPAVCVMENKEPSD